MQEDPNPIGMDVEKLKAVRDALDELVDESTGKVHACVSRAGERTIVIQGNTAGLVELAHYVIGAALSRKHGLHTHLDELSLFSEFGSELDLIIQYAIEPER